MSNIVKSEQEKIRRESLDKIKDMKIIPYPAAEFETNFTSEEIYQLSDLAITLYNGIKKASVKLLKCLKIKDVQVNSLYKKIREIREHSKFSEKDIALIYEQLKDLAPLSTKPIRQKLSKMSIKKLIPYLPKKNLIKIKPEKNLNEVSLAGRIMSRRIMGNASFAEIQDSKGRIQIYIRRDDLCPGEDKTRYNTFFKKLLDIGDIIGVKGYVFKTQMGETTIHVKELKLLCKSLRPLPIVKEKGGKTWDAFMDMEQRYRNRSMDLVVNPRIKKVFIKRT